MDLDEEWPWELPTSYRPMEQYVKKTVAARKGVGGVSLVFAFMMAVATLTLNSPSPLFIIWFLFIATYFLASAHGWSRAGVYLSESQIRVRSIYREWTLERTEVAEVRSIGRPQRGGVEFVSRDGSVVKAKLAPAPSQDDQYLVLAGIERWVKGRHDGTKQAESD